MPTDPPGAPAPDAPLPPLAACPHRPDGWCLGCADEHRRRWHRLYADAHLTAQTAVRITGEARDERDEAVAALAELRADLRALVEGDRLPRREEDLEQAAAVQAALLEVLAVGVFDAVDAELLAAHARREDHDSTCPDCHWARRRRQARDRARGALGLPPDAGDS
jgi:hypothetical protein